MEIKILAICDDFYHHGEIIKEGLAFLADECQITFAGDAAGELCQYDAVILAKDDQISKSNRDSWLTEDAEKRLAEYAAAGGGLIFLHAGCVLCKKSQLLESIAGCKFISHPEQCVVDFTMPAPHAITDGAKEFSEMDEHYFIDFSATDADIFLEGKSPSGAQPAGYARTHGGGRVCVLTPGHNLSVFFNGEYQKIITNAVHWCAKK